MSDEQVILQGVKSRAESWLSQLGASRDRRPKGLIARYGPIGMQAARRSGEVGFEGLATLVNPGVYLTPNYPTQANPKVADDGDFVLCSVNMSVEFSWTYTTAPGYSGGAPVDSRAVAGLYDAAIRNNGGAVALDNSAGTQQYSGAEVRPRVGCELDIYDLTRGRSITPNGRVSNEVLTGGTYGFKDVPRTTFPHGTEIEPRLFVTECRMTSDLDTTTPFNAASVAAWVTLVLKGYMVKLR